MSSKKSKQLHQVCILSSDFYMIVTCRSEAVPDIIVDVSYWWFLCIVRASEAYPTWYVRYNVQATIQDKAAYRFRGQWDKQKCKHRLNFLFFFSMFRFTKTLASKGSVCLKPRLPAVQASVFIHHDRKFAFWHVVLISAFDSLLHARHEMWQQLGSSESKRKQQPKIKLPPKLLPVSSNNNRS